MYISLKGRHSFKKNMMTSHLKFFLCIIKYPVSVQIFLVVSFFPPTVDWFESSKVILQLTMYFISLFLSAPEFVEEMHYLS